MMNRDFDRPIFAFYVISHSKELQTADHKMMWRVQVPGRYNISTHDQQCNIGQ